VRARARFNGTLGDGIVAAQHGWCSPSTGIVNLNNLVKSSRSNVIQAWSRSAAEDIGRAEQLHLDIFEQDTGSSLAHSTMGMVPGQTPGRSVADRAQGAARGAAVVAFAPPV